MSFLSESCWAYHLAFAQVSSRWFAGYLGVVDFESGFQYEQNWLILLQGSVIKPEQNKKILNQYSRHDESYMKYTEHREKREATWAARGVGQLTEGFKD